MGPAFVWLLAALAASCHPTEARKLLAPAAPGQEYFVRVEGLEFVQGCQKFYVSGANIWEAVEAAAGAPYLSGASIPVGMTGPELVRTLMDQAVAAGLNTLRIWAHSVNPQYALQTAPGQYNEAVFQGLDYLLDEARKRGLKLILAFASNWTPVGGIPEYLKWAGMTKPVQFYTESQPKDMYKGFVRTVLNRVNSINGRKYLEDPTVLAWNLINEPRCQGCPENTIANWVSEMAAFVKSIDPNHLLTTGEDGFYGCCKAPANPGVQYTEWAAQEGQNFLADHASPNIDFAAFHSWVDNWQEVSEQFLRTWVTNHVNDAQSKLAKPVLFEEFGKWINTNATPPATLSDRKTWFQFAYNLISSTMQQPGSALKGAMFWQFYAPGQEAPNSEGSGRGLFGVYPDDEAFQYVRQHAAVAKQLSTPLDSCSPAAHKAASAPAPPSCPTGFEGPNCGTDINECVRGTANCDPNASCVNTKGGFDCKCQWGYDGDGKTCTPNQRAIQELQNVYWSQPQGLGCDAGLDVPWPAYGPGYLYDPIGSFNFFNTTGGGKFGSRTNVTLLQCMAACQMVEECESFGYNDVLESCFLKSNQCPAANSCWDKEVMCLSDNDRGGNFSFPCGFWRSYYRLDMDTDSACANVTGNPPLDQANLAPFKQFESQLGNALGRNKTNGSAAAKPPAAGGPALAAAPAGEAAGPATTGAPTNGSAGAVPLLTDFLGGAGTVILPDGTGPTPGSPLRNISNIAAAAARNATAAVPSPSPGPATGNGTAPAQNATASAPSPSPSPAGGNGTAPAQNATALGLADFLRSNGESVILLDPSVQASNGPGGK